MIYLSYRNGARAHEKGFSGVLFGFLTFLLYLVTTVIGVLITFFAVFRNTLDPVRMEKDNYNYSRELAAQFVQEIIANPIHYLAILMCGLGGYMLVQYIVGRLPNKNEQINKMQ